MNVDDSQDESFELDEFEKIFDSDDAEDDDDDEENDYDKIFSMFCFADEDEDEDLAKNESLKNDAIQKVTDTMEEFKELFEK